MLDAPTDTDCEKGTSDDRALLGNGEAAIWPREKIPIIEWFRPGLRRPPTTNSNPKALRVLSIVLHSTILMLHVAFMIMCFVLQHPEHTLVIPLDKQGTASTIATVLLQFTGIVRFCAFLVNLF